MFALVAVLPPVLLVACTSHVTPQAALFATLKASAAGIDSYRTSYEASAARGAISPAQKHACDVQFNKANDAIIAASRAARDAGQLGDTPTPAAVDEAVRSFVSLVTTLIPPKER